MSNLIVMPGSKEFTETISKVKTAKAPRPKPLENLTGHTLLLNTAVTQKFQCGGFQLSIRRPFAIVTEDAQQIPLHAALESGQLIDVTGQDMTKGYKGKGGETSAIQEKDTGNRVFIATDKRGNLYVATPKSKAQAKRFEKEIRETGQLASVDFEQQVSGLTGITEEVVESSETIPSPAKKGHKPRVRSANRKRKS